MDWHKAIHEFWAASTGQRWMNVDKSGNVRFRARVRIKTSTDSCDEVTTVRIFRSGREDGTVRLEECGALSLNRFHTEYKPIGTGSCRYRATNNSLSLSGSSNKCGAYEVSIVPGDA
jgi:hypothetical protein